MLTLVQFPITGLQNIPEMLRNLAANIESGKHGNVDSLAVVLHNENGLELFGFGDARDTTAHFMFHAAAVKMAMAITG